ncbi:MAG: nitroreductase family protein [Candidatus Thermoplasmatota archaeon]|nr:nitroreductase family protein [Candidatus Thermoplasmatota archaeon]
MEFIDVIKSRRSIRGYSDRSVEDDKIEYVLECARLAPSWMNKQCWRFVVVREKERIEELAKASIINRWLRKVPVILVACADSLSSGKKKDMEYFGVDVAIAMEHIILAATDIGLGSCWIGGFDEEKVKRALEIPPRIRVVALTPLGYPAQKEGISEKGRKIISRSTKRKSLREIVRYEKW